MARYSNNYRNVIVYISFCFAFWLAFFSGLRLPGISNDDLNYIYFYKNGIGNFEYLFTSLTRIVHYFNADVSIYFTIISFLSLSVLFISLFKFDKRVVAFGLLIYSSHIFLYRDYIQIRAAISYNFLLLGFVYLLLNKNSKGIFVYFIAFMFHKTAVVFSLFSLLINKIKFKFETRYILSLCFFSYFISVLGLNKSLIQFFISFLPAALTISINTYLSESSKFVYELSVFNPTTMKILIYVCIFSYFRDDLKRFFCSDLPYYLYVLSFFIIVLFSPYAVFASRFSSSFSLVELIIIPVITFIICKNKMLFWFFFVSCFLQMILNVVYKDFVYISIF